MPIEIVQQYTREVIKANREKMFVFGDNMARKGYGGQAKACRGEPNALGIPTKWYPDCSKKSFFKDDDIVKVEPVIAAAFDAMSAQLQAGRVVVWPADGIGTGLARLEEKAPAIFKYITNRWAHLVNLHGGEQ